MPTDADIPHLAGPIEFEPVDGWELCQPPRLLEKPVSATAPAWFDRIEVLRIIGRLRRNPPARVFTRDNGRNWHDGSHDFVGLDVDKLNAAFTPIFSAELHRRPSDQTACRTLLESGPDEILAALFGDPNGLDWAHPARAERRRVLAAAIGERVGRHRMAVQL